MVEKFVPVIRRAAKEIAAKKIPATAKPSIETRALITKKSLFAATPKQVSATLQRVSVVSSNGYHIAILT